MKHSQRTSRSGIEDYEHELARVSNALTRERLLQDARQQYFQAVRKVGVAYADALLTQMANAL